MILCFTTQGERAKTIFPLDSNRPKKDNESIMATVREK